MSFYNYSENRFLVLLEQIKLSLLSGKTITDTIAEFSQKYSEFYFLRELYSKISQGKNLNDALLEQQNGEISQKTKKLLEALGSGDFAVQKIDDIRTDLIKSRKEDFENVSSGLTGKIGWLALFAIAPVAVYFLGSMAEIFKSIEMGDLVISDSIKLIVIAVCMVIFLVMLFSRRLKNA